MRENEEGERMREAAKEKWKRRARVEETEV